MNALCVSNGIPFFAYVVLTPAAPLCQARKRVYQFKGPGSVTGAKPPGAPQAGVATEGQQVAGKGRKRKLSAAAAPATGE